MTAKAFKVPAALFGLAIALTFGVSLSSARQPAKYAQENQENQENKDKEKEEKGEKKVKVNKAEEAAYKKVLAVQAEDPAMQIPVAEDFVAKFPMSRYLPGVYGMLTTAYYTTGQTDKMFATGAKALELNPDNVDVLALLAMAIPRRVKANTPGGPQQLQNAETYANRAIGLIPNMTKPEAIDDAAFEKAKNDKLALCHSGLGLLALDHQKYDDARNELTQAVTLASSPDPVDYYLLGNADDKASFLNGAVAAYEKCAATGPLTTQCKAREDAVKKTIAAGNTLSRD